jgi:uncharacterized repeat protein (TIGR03803 family)
MRKNSKWRRSIVTFLLCTATAFTLNAQTFTTLVNFSRPLGIGPQYMTLIQGLDGELYGPTTAGGIYNGGTAFKVSLGRLKTIYSFCLPGNCPDGSYPEGGLLQATNGKLYGTASGGGNSSCSGGCGTVFEITRDGILTTIYTFCSEASCSDGTIPRGALVQGTDGSLYGTTAGGGSTRCSSGCGTVFRITPQGKLNTLHRFTMSDGLAPTGGLIQATDGNFYGTTSGGGYSEFAGTIFEITSGGELTTLYKFCAKSSCPDGGYPWAGLVQGEDGNFYGTTTGAGQGLGTVFSVTSGGVLTTLYDFCSLPSCADGAFPESGLIQSTDGNFYGTTSADGLNGQGGTISTLPRKAA